ncbi:MAG TPA: hypothetical protein VK973_08650 [Arenicellales bacterium]|nr:hypothetical protein [Arenicellales bacterium]
MRLEMPSKWLLPLAVVWTVFAAPPSTSAGSVVALPPAEESHAPTARPLAPDYRIHADGSVTQRVCFNWSCKSRQRITITAADMAEVVNQMALCPGDSLYDRLQRLRIGIWQMETLAEKYQPLLANDEAVNDRDQGLNGRMDCVDNASNTTTYLNVLSDLGLLPGWSIKEPRIRHRFSELVHWTAVVVDSRDAGSWSVDTWLRPNGHLPFVMPLQAWKDDKVPWDPPFAALNPVPSYSSQFCQT